MVASVWCCRVHSLPLLHLLLTGRVEFGGALWNSSDCARVDSPRALFDWLDLLFHFLLGSPPCFGSFLF